MKWGKHSEKATERVERLAAKVFGSKGLYVLMALAAFLLLSSATDKWAD